MQGHTSPARFPKYPMSPPTKAPATAPTTYLTMVSHSEKAASLRNRSVFYVTDSKPPDGGTRTLDKHGGLHSEAVVKSGRS
jgi:hypothetical protein